MITMHLYRCKMRRLNIFLVRENTMGNILSEGLQYIGRIDDDGYVFDCSGNCVAKINDSGYIGKVGGGEIFG